MNFQVERLGHGRIAGKVLGNGHQLQRGTVRGRGNGDGKRRALQPSAFEESPADTIHQQFDPADVHFIRGSHLDREGYACHQRGV